MLTDDDIRRLLQQRAETPNLDYKAGFAWTRENRDLKYELVRDLIAMANTQDGGRIVFGVTDGDLRFVGVSEETFTSVDVTSVLEMLHANADPKVRCTVYKREIDGMRMVVFDVAEFEETPIICTKTIWSTDGAGPKRMILRESAIYVRTGAASTVEVTAADDMRSLVTRAVRRKQAELLQAMSAILSGRPAATTDDSVKKFEAEIKKAQDFFQSELEAAG